MADFPAQPSQKDGIGRMCKPHWNAYTTALRKAAAAAKASDNGAATDNAPESEPIKTTPSRAKAKKPVDQDPEAATE